MAPQRFMLRARRAPRCSPRRRKAPRPGWSARAAVSAPRRAGWNRPQRDGGATWVLYGANIGAAGGTLSIVSPADDLRALADAELTHAGQSHAMAPKDLVPTGETRDIHRAGGHCL